ncbi:efflux RND transporter periplasmic adaptor subunit [Bradyrhizobium sp. SSUT18]|uniref:efflux RND transporter periplasmic adaptor subunit n=1 Tax=Bradyrhizobium sp. SSUT18 TaxID=3040602 RepID=UPI002448039D|nr:efflux RND transporter periplasmic adaptor subunit [Bradyrhizobium sp. SSUT18]MDH2401855.1 efflux RND transporter periplasmic adaptor subunit [Bradyrhizobium sp. SSUT18]
MNDVVEIKGRDRVPRTEATPRPTNHAPHPGAPPRRNSSSQRLRIVAAILVLALVGWGAKLVLFPQSNANLVTAPVVLGNIEQDVLATGTLKPVKLVALGAQASGRLVSLKVALGQTVKAGDLIAEIDSLTQQNTLRTNQAALQNTRAQRAEKEASLALAEANFSRQQTTLAQKASSRADYDSAEANVKTTEAQIEQLDAQIIEAEVAVETARVNLGYTRIVAPIDGTVLSIVTQEGQTVNAVQSAPTIVVLGQLDTMTIRAEISEADVVRCRPGQKVYFTILGDPAHRYEAKLESIEPAPESIKTDSSFTSTTTTSSSSSSSSSSTSSAIYYNGIFNVPNPAGDLRTYMTAEVHVVLGEAHDVLTVPVAALGETAADGTARVRVVDSSGAVVTRTVKVGLSNKILTEVRGGVVAGERVVVSGNDAPHSKSSLPPPPGT